MIDQHFTVHFIFSFDFIQQEWNMEEITIERAVLHILDTGIGAPVLSDRALPLDESTDFFKRHIEKLAEDSEMKECVFEAGGNPVRDLIGGMKEENFISVTQQLAASLYEIMVTSAEIPAADVLFAVFRSESDRFLGIVKFNYKEAYTHKLESIEGKTAATVIKYKALLANESQKVDECIFTSLNSLKIKMKEKKYEIDGRKDYYLSPLFLRTKPARSYKEQLRLVEKSAEKVVKKYYAGDSLKQAEVTMAIKNNVDRNMEIDIDDLGKEVFHDSPDMQTQYKQELTQKGSRKRKLK
jgi:hypothetical protein